MPKVWNKRKEYPQGAIYIGRPSRWGNPYVIGRDGTREEVIEKYRDYIKRQGMIADIKHSLKGKDLVCWCKPAACHGDILLEIANAEE